MNELERMKGENVCIFDCKYIISMTLVLLFIAIIWLNNISTVPKLNCKKIKMTNFAFECELKKPSQLVEW